MMCRCLKVSRSGYYAWLGREPSRTVRRRKELSALIEWVFNSSHGTYGYRRVHAALARRGVETSPDTVRSVMREQGLEAAQPRRKVRTTVPAADLGSRPDLVRRNFTASQPGVKWVGDITYIRTWEGFVYLATVLDCCTKKAVGYAMADNMRTDLICEAIDMAARRCPYTTGETVFHSIPLGPGLPVHLRPARQAPGELRHSPLGGQGRGVLGGCPGGSRRARPSRNERAYQMVHHRKNQDHPGYRLPGQPRYTRSETAPLRPGVQDTGRGRPGAPSSKTTSPRHHFQSRPRHTRQPTSMHYTVLTASRVRQPT